ncbi:F-box DNA helicase 1 isoform X3 [Hemicordylus capensis]|uniref:F-box DNA helicase 1 isoform X3 n=1 Tax=Hemicordylus capensis TaxID=884348 RepID=UPI0023042F09|nr:F-box DNA helicase 1 isoform X3 [Hemicordylus capensis]
MRRSKQLRLTASDCEALSQTQEGTSSLTQPFSQRQGSRYTNRGLYPAHRTKKHPRGSGSGHQSTITDYFRSKTRPSQCGVDMAQANKIKAENSLASSFVHDEEFLDIEDSCSLLGGNGDVAPVTPRKRPRFSQSTNSCHTDCSQWDQDDKHFLDRFSEQSPDHVYLKQEVDDITQEANAMEVDPLPDACFGLLGTVSWDVPQGHIDQLPDEILREIFALAPAIDVFQNISLVCHRWHLIVSDPQFIPWKKLYLQYLKAEARALLTLNTILHRYGLTQEQSQCMLGFIRCVAAMKSRRCRDHKAILTCLKSHTLFPKAEICVAKRLPDLDSPQEGTPNVWAVMAAIVLFSGGVCDIQELVSCLRRPNSTLSLMDIIEALYCMATVLYAMREKGVNVSNRIHYNIFYCLYLLENNCGMAVVKPAVPSCSYERGLSNNPGIQPTCEQQQILNHAIAPRQVVKIMAFAGTGKTSTLVKYAEKWSSLRFLYLAFNKTIAEQGGRVFPRNVTCKTVHSLAFSEVGKHYSQKGKLNFGSLTSYWVSFILQNREGQSPFIRAKTVIQTLETFFASADPSITVEHAPIWCKNTKGAVVPVQEEEKKIIVKEANQIWSKMKMLSPTKEMAYKMTHDGYLKLWQLKKPFLSNYDAIFVDEAQDCTPAIIDIVLSQPCGVILVGDPHQQIYTFRGAVNALSQVPHTHIFYLTQSFRFGPEIAYVGATILDVCKKVRNKMLVGSNQEGNVNMAGMGGKMALLSRNNQTIFEDAVRLTSGDSPAKIHFLGGLTAFGLEKIHDIWKLLHPELRLEVKDSFFKKWIEKGFVGLKSYAMSADDKQLEMKIAIVEKYRDRIPELVERISQCHVLAPEAADAISEDEWNLLYVAVTRAKRHLVMPKFLTYLLTFAGEYYLRPELTSDVCKGTPVWCCVRGCCNSIPAESLLTMKQMPFVYSDGTKDPEGYLCHACVEQRIGPLAWLTVSPEVVETMESTEEDLEIPQNINILFAWF